MKVRRNKMNYQHQTMTIRELTQMSEEGLRAHYLDSLRTINYPKEDVGFFNFLDRDKLYQSKEKFIFKQDKSNLLNLKLLK